MTESVNDAAAAQAAPQARPAPSLQLDKSRPFSENIGETTPDDPLHRVRYWQGQKFQGHMILLPFDAHGKLVADDKRTEPFEGIGPEGKKVTYHPLWDDKMRALFTHKTQRAAAAIAPAAENEDGTETGDEAGGNPADDVNFAAWLKGEARYTPQALRAAAKSRYAKNYQDLGQLVIDLVEDEKVVDEAEVCAALAKHLRSKAAA